MFSNRGPTPFTTAIAGGTIRVVGELADVDRLVVEAHVESLDLKLFDYQLRNDGNIELALRQRAVEVRRLRVIGEGTQRRISDGIGTAR